MSWEIREGDALELLRQMPEDSVQCCVTSPPYWGLRDYGVPGQLGLEPTFGEYLERLVTIFEEVRRVLRPDGTLWLNMGDSYSRAQTTNVPQTKDRRDRYPDHAKAGTSDGAVGRGDRPGSRATGKPKDLIGQPWRLAFALQAAGWWLRADIVWAKPNPMPESVRDRPTKAHEMIFLLSKSPRYYYDADAIAEPAIHAGRVVEYDGTQKNSTAGDEANDRRTLIGNGAPRSIEVAATRNARSVWTIATSPFPEAHFATFPPELPRRCIAAGSRPGDTVLDPFCGAGTTLLVAERLQRHSIGLELNPEYARIARKRIEREALPLFGGPA